MTSPIHEDWGEASEVFDRLSVSVNGRNLADINEAQTRYDVIDRLIRDVLGWHYGQVFVEEPNEGERRGYVDYILRSGDYVIVVEAKKAGASFPSPTKRPKLKITGSVLSSGDIAKAISQAEEYASSKKADVVVVTNGLCWCFYSMHDRDSESYATLLFPFQSDGHGEELFNLFSVRSVEKGSLSNITNRLPSPEDRLISAFRHSDARVDRNNIADYIVPALNNALYADALLSNFESLKKCFVATEVRIKFDTVLGMHLADPKPEVIKPARRIRKGKEQDHLEQIVSDSIPTHAPPVTLIIGPVGVGKSTYLKHFETISGAKVLQRQEAHWIYIDFEKMGRDGKPREFLYRSLLNYLNEDHPNNPTDYKSAIQPAYNDDIAALARGPFAPIYTNKEEFNKIIVAHIKSDLDKVEPYVDKVLKYIASRKLCIIILDNIDLYEDDKLETTVFSEGLALSKRIHCHVFVSLRDTTFVRHKSDATFDAYELRKLWLDPPPFRTVLSARLSYSKKILEGKSARIPLANGMHLSVDDLSVFFDIVQKSILKGQAGDYIEAIADLNIRKGLSLVNNFLTSGHIQADRAIEAYINGNTTYIFPFHEIFKGTMLGQWRHFREDRADCINLFDSRLGFKNLRLLRLSLLNYIVTKAQSEHTMEVPVSDCIHIFSNSGASENQILGCLSFLHNKSLIRSSSADELTSNSTIVATRAGGYYIKILTRKFVYVETCMFDTAIEDADTWRELSELTATIQTASAIANRMELRRSRMNCFLDYLCTLEEDFLNTLGTGRGAYLSTMNDIKPAVIRDVNDAVAKSKRNYNSGRK